MAETADRIRAVAFVASAPDMTIATLKQAYASAIPNAKVVNAVMTNAAVHAVNAREAMISVMNMLAFVCRIARAETVGMMVAVVRAAIASLGMNVSRISA